MNDAQEAPAERRNPSGMTYGDVVLEASDLLRRHSEQGAWNAWQLTPARAR